MKRSPMPPRTAALARKPRAATAPSDFRDDLGHPIPAPPPRRRRSPRRNIYVPRDWTKRVFTLHGATCFVTGRRAENAHHIIKVSVLIDLGLGELCGDPRNGMPLTRRVHDRHELAVERVLRSSLPPSAFAFAADHGLEWYLDDERIYPRVPRSYQGRL